VTACSAGDSPTGKEGGYICSFTRSLVRRYEVVDAFYWGSGDVVGIRVVSMRITQLLNRSIVAAALRRGTNSSGFRDLTIPCENLSLPLTSVLITTRAYPHAVRRLRWLC
jgi:hypothetical protein